METITLKVSDIRKLVKESINEFEPKLGSGVKSGNKDINGKAYKDAKKRAKDYDGGLEDEILEKKPKYDKTQDDNKTTLDYNPIGATKEYKDRIKAQVKGYTSVAEKNNGIEKAGDFSDNENIYKELKRSHEENDKNRVAFEKSGLQAREWPDKTFEREHMMEGRSIKTVRFKKTTFLTEGHMISRIPDEFKKEGLNFIMEDKTGNKYTIEWKDNRANIIGHENKAGMNESINRMKELMGYKPGDSKTSKDIRLNENYDGFKGMVDKVRNIGKE